MNDRISTSLQFSLFRCEKGTYAIKFLFFKEIQEIEKESNVYLHFALDNYYLYDTFINDAKICPDHTKLFEELTGYNKKIMKRCIDENKIELSTTFLVKIGKIVHMLRIIIRQIKIK